MIMPLPTVLLVLVLVLVPGVCVSLSAIHKWQAGERTLVGRITISIAAHLTTVAISIAGEKTL